MAPSGAPFSVLVHPYCAPSAGTCAYEQGDASSKNAVIFIGGLTDGPHTTGFIRTVARHLEQARRLDYSVFEVRLRSSFTGFGTSSLARDVEDISALVTHLRRLGREKVVLFGHSTGSQDCIEYADYATHGNAPVDGFILQGPVSDRESLDSTFPDYQASLELATQWIAQGRAKDCLPADKGSDALGAPMSAYRFHSLCAEGGDDDYFSSDLDDETVARVWGRFDKPVLVLHSAADEYVPARIDQAAASRRYRDASRLVSPLSGLIPGAGHAVPQDEAREWLARRVVAFLETLGG